MLKRILLLLGLAVLLPGCIEFERQTVTYEHDPKADTLLIHQAYHGLYGADDVTQLSQQEREQLASVMKGQRTFFFANWIFELNVEGFKNQLTEIATPKSNSLEEAHRRAQTNVLALLVANVRVENGKFYLDDQGRPCGTQRVTIRNVSKIIEAGNALMRRALEVEMKKLDSAAERALMNESLAHPEPFFSLTGQQVRFRFPLAKEEYDKLGQDDEKLRHFLAEFVRLGGTLSHERGEIHVSFGRSNEVRETVTLPMAGKESYRPNALMHIRDIYSVTKEYDPKKDAEEFLKAIPAKDK